MLYRSSTSNNRIIFIKPLYSYGNDRFLLKEQSINDIFSNSIYSKLANTTLPTSKPWAQCKDQKSIVQVSDVIFICLCPNPVWFNLFFEPLIQASMNKQGLFLLGRVQILAISTTKVKNVMLAFYL